MVLQKIKHASGDDKDYRLALSLQEKYKEAKTEEAKKKYETAFYKALENYIGNKNTPSSVTKEMHMPGGYNYLGPGTNVYKRLLLDDPPINEVDAIAKRHDIAYISAKNWKHIRKADKEMLKSLEAFRSKSKNKKLNAAAEISYKLIKAKTILPVDKIFSNINVISKDEKRNNSTFINKVINNDSTVSEDMPPKKSDGVIKSIAGKAAKKVVKTVGEKVVDEVVDDTLDVIPFPIKRLSKYLADKAPGIDGLKGALLRMDKKEAEQIAEKDWDYIRDYITGVKKELPVKIVGLDPDESDKGKPEYKVPQRKMKSIIHRRSNIGKVMPDDVHKMIHYVGNAEKHVKAIRGESPKKDPVKEAPKPVRGEPVKESSDSRESGAQRRPAATEAPKPVRGEPVKEAPKPVRGTNNVGGMGESSAVAASGAGAGAEEKKSGEIVSTPFTEIDEMRKLLDQMDEIIDSGGGGDGDDEKETKENTTQTDGTIKTKKGNKKSTISGKRVLKPFLYHATEELVRLKPEEDKASLDAFKDFTFIDKGYGLGSGNVLFKAQEINREEMRFKNDMFMPAEAYEEEVTPQTMGEASRQKYKVYLVPEIQTRQVMTRENAPSAKHVGFGRPIQLSSELDHPTMTKRVNALDSRLYFPNIIRGKNDVKSYRV